MTHVQFSSHTLREMKAPTFWEGCEESWNYLNAKKYWYDSPNFDTCCQNFLFFSWWNILFRDKNPSRIENKMKPYLSTMRSLNRWPIKLQCMLHVALTLILHIIIICSSSLVIARGIISDHDINICNPRPEINRTECCVKADN